MFNLLNFFKKKTLAPASLEELAAGSQAEKPIRLDRIAIHAMPERFRRQPKPAASAKTAGLMIMGGGAVILILASAFLYFYLFKKEAVPSQEEPLAAAEEANEPAAIAPEIEPLASLATSTVATTTPPEVLPGEETAATSTVASSTPETIEPDLTIGLIPSLDSDLDGLSDAEEIVLETSTSTPDTDGDGYLDGVELLNLYDPASTTSLTANPNIQFYENKTFNYSLLYPKAWPPSLNGGDDSIMFKTGDNQFFQIIAQANAAKQPLDQWYIEQLATAAINDSDRVYGSNWQGIKNLDGLTLYLTDAKQDYIFTLAYNPGENNILDYIDMFGMMMKSFTLKE